MSPKEGMDFSAFLMISKFNVKIVFYLKYRLQNTFSSFPIESMSLPLSLNQLYIFFVFYIRKNLEFINSNYVLFTVKHFKL